MSELLKKRPSVADLTGINESRLDCFATSVRSYLSGPSSTSARASISGSPCIISSTSNSHNTAGENYPSAPNVPPPQQAVTESSSSSLTVTAAYKLPDAALMETTSNSDLHRSSADEAQKHISNCKISLDFLESLSEITMPPSFRPICLNQQSLLTPYYCWCPPSAPSNESIISPLPPHPSLSLSDLPPNLDFPTTFLPDPFPNLVNSHQNIPTFTPLMCDLPIVHIPVIDVGQGYLVSAGPTIPPLHPKLVNHHHHSLIPEPNSSALEKGARETLRFLLGGSSALTSTIPGGEKMDLFGGNRDATAVGIGLISLTRLPGLDGDNTGTEVNDDDEP